MEKINTDYKQQTWSFREHPPHRLLDAPSSFLRSSLGLARIFDVVVCVPS